MTKPYKQLIWTFVYYLILIFQFSGLAYYFFWKYDVDGTTSTQPAPGYHCNTLHECFIIAFDQTLKEPGSIGSYFDFFDENAFLNDNYRTIYDVLYRIVIPIVMLSLVKGIIVDTFSNLREQEQKTLEDMENKCYICGIERQEFDKIRTRTFKEHIEIDHNMWNYIFFIIYLQDKNKKEYDGEEQYVDMMLKEKNFGWIPYRQATEEEENPIEKELRSRLTVEKQKLQELKQDYRTVVGSLNKYVKTIS